MGSKQRPLCKSVITGHRRREENQPHNQTQFQRLSLEDLSKTDTSCTGYFTQYYRSFFQAIVSIAQKVYGVDIIYVQGPHITLQLLFVEWVPKNCDISSTRSPLLRHLEGNSQPVNFWFRSKTETWRQHKFHLVNATNVTHGLLTCDKKLQKEKL